MRLPLFLFTLFLTLHLFSFAQPGGNTTCQTADPFCGSAAYTYPAGTCSMPTGCNAQPGPNYGCLNSTPNPAWFYLQIGSSGNVIISITESPYEDVDYICWGPFTTPTGACVNGLGNNVSCSYSGSGNETCTINNAIAGQFYILLITNYSNQPTNISFVQSNWGFPGAGTTNCNIVTNCSMSAIAATPTACNPSTNTFDIHGNVEFSNPPATGTLTVADITAIPQVQQTFSPPFISPTIFSLTGITCDGNTHTLLAGFSDSTACQKTQNCQAPPSECPTATMSGGGNVCNDGFSTGTVYIAITGGSYPYSFTYEINSIPQPPIVNYIGLLPVLINATVPGTYTMLSVSDNACSGTVSGSAVVNFLPLPVVTFAALNPVCINVAPFALTGGSPAGGTYSGSGVTGGIFNPFAAGTGSHTITYTYTDNNNCTNSSQSFLTVNPIPVVTVVPGITSICSGTQTNVTFLSNVLNSSYTWTASSVSPNITGFSNGNGDVINQVLFNSGTTIDSVTYTVTPHASGCDGSPVTFSIIVFPVPNVNTTPASPSICSGQTTNFLLTSDVAGTSFTWTASGSANVTGYSNGSGNSIGQILINTGFNVETVTYQITPHANNCDGLFITYIVTVFPSPNLSNSPLNKQLCNNSNTNLTLTSNVIGTLFTWTATASSGNVTGWNNNAVPSVTLNDLLVNSGFNIETVTYHIMSHANGCDGNITNYIVTVYPTTDLANDPLMKEICNNTSTGISLTSNVTGTLFTWTATPSSGSVSGFSNNAVPSTLLNQVLTNTSFVDQTVTFHITPHANGCDGIVYDYIVTVHPQADLSNSPLNKQQCSGLPTNINLTSNVAGTTFTWTCTASSGNVTGWSNNNLPTIILNQTLTNSGFNIETVTYHITAVANGCIGNNNDFAVTIYPVPDLSNAPLTETLCKGNNTNMVLTSHVAGTLFTWTCTPSSGFVTGYSDNAVPATLLSQVLHNSNNVDEFVTYHITPHSNGCDGPVTDFLVTVKPRPILTVNPMSKTICSGNLVNITLSASCTGTTYAWVPQLVSGNVTGFASGSGPVIGDILTNNIATAGVVTYTVSFQAQGCTGNDSVYTVTVNPTPHVSTNPLLSGMCSGSTTNISLISDVAGTSYSYAVTGSSPNVTGFSGGVNPIISQTLINSGFSIETVTYHITPHANGCDGPVSNFVVTVFPVPDLSNNPPSEQICNNQSTNLTLTSDVTGTLFTWTCTPSSGNVTGYSNINIPTTLLNQTLVNSGFSIETVTYHLTPHSNGCDGPVTDFVVTLVSKPDLTNSPPAKQICNNTSTNVNLTSNVNGTLFTWTASRSSGNVSGYSDNAVPTVILSQTLVNSGFNFETVTYHITPHANGCDGDVTTFIVTVYPTPDLTNTLSKSQCNNVSTNIGLTSNVAGTQFTWTCTPSSANVTGFSNNAVPSVLLNQTLINSGFNIETVTYHITPQANGCNGIVYNYVVTVYPTADVYYLPVAQTLCSQQTTNIGIQSHVTGSTFSWTATPSSLNLSGFAGGSGNLIAQTITNSGTTIETVTYHSTPTANSCVGTPSDVIVTVDPTPHVTTLPLNQTICAGFTTSINLTSSVAGSTFAWTVTSSSPNLTGFSAGNGNTINQTIANSGFTIETVTYHIIPTANGCAGPNSDLLVTVNPTPDVSNNPLTSSICSSTSTNIGLLSHVTGATFSWTAVPSSPNITGFAPGNGLVINQVLVNSGFNNETVTYHITPTANGCVGPSKDFVVTIFPVPDVYFNPISQILCSNQTTNIQNLSHVAGTTFTWTAAPSSGNLSGFSPGNGNLIDQTLLNAGSTIETVTYTVTPVANGCPAGTSHTVVITIDPRPTVTNNLTSFQICSATPTNIPLQADVPGTTFAWTASGSSGNVTGYSNSSGPVITQTLTNSDFNPESVTYTVTPTANGCTGNPLVFTVTVFPVADVYFTPLSQTFCSGGTTNLVLQSHVAGATFTWTSTGSSPNVTGFSPGSGTLIQQTLLNGGYMSENVNYAANPTANGCPGIITHGIVTVNPWPVVSLTTCWDPVTTTDAQSVKLKGGTPLGGTYSGTGVNLGIFYPGIAGAGTFTINYSYTNTFGCVNAGSQTINVISPVVQVCGNTLTDIRDNAQYPTIQLGTQCWMASNLNFGNTIQVAQMQLDNCISEKYCYGDAAANCTTMGGLYQWDEVMKFDNNNGAQGFCPPGWHIPTETEWGILFKYYTSNGFAGSALKYSGYSGFDAFLYGVRHENEKWDFSDFATMYWSSTTHAAKKAWAHGMNTFNPSVSYYPSLKANAFSVRCIKD